MIEYELKYLGPQENLKQCFKRFVNALPSVRDRHYAFNTYYLDTPRWAYYKSGYSIRHRTGAPEAGLFGGTEIKATGGETSGWSSRVELQREGLNFYKNLFNLLARLDLPKDLPLESLFDLELKYVTSVKRWERQAFVSGCLIEAALDDLTILAPCKESPTRFSRVPENFYDTLLVDKASMFELEFEIKSPLNQSLEELKRWIEKTCIEGVPSVYPTKESKATRARNLSL